jgi:hypothetical protein
LPAYFSFTNFSSALGSELAGLSFASALSRGLSFALDLIEAMEKKKKKKKRKKTSKFSSSSHPSKRVAKPYVLPKALILEEIEGIAFSQKIIFC